MFDLVGLFKKAHIWFLRREFEQHLENLRYYIERSAFDLNVSAYDYRMSVTNRRNRLRKVAAALAVLGVDVSDEGEDLKWQ